MDMQKQSVDDIRNLESMKESQAVHDMSVEMRCMALAVDIKQMATVKIANL